MQRLKPLLEKYNVTSYMCGHDHNLQHISDAGVEYFVTGAGHLIDPSMAHEVCFNPWICIKWRVFREILEPLSGKIRCVLDSTHVYYGAGIGLCFFMLHQTRIE